MKRHVVRAVGVLTLPLALAACDDEDDGLGLGDDEIALELVADGLAAPVALVSPPGDSDLRFVVDQAGVIRVLREDDTLVDTPFLDLRGRMVTLRTDFDERGLLGLAFHPDYEDNGRFFVYYSAPLRPGAPLDWNHTSHISEFRVSNNPEIADAGSERLLLAVDQPQFNHDGGTVAFGPDGFLYISLGDGGAANDLALGHLEDWYDDNGGGNAQNLTTLLGKILRIDVDGAMPYAIPATNPFVGEDGRDEIYAYGFRNPYRFSFDPVTGDLLVADAGQNRYEEVSRVTLGGNYGWNVYEGAHCFDAEAPDSDPTGCPTAGSFGEPLVLPVIEYRNVKIAEGVGIAVVGGHVYRGDEVDALEGRYVFGDYSTSFDDPDGTVFVATPAASGPWSFEELTFPDRAGGRLGHFLLGLGVDGEGELYLLATDSGAPTGSTGRVYRIVD